MHKSNEIEQALTDKSLEYSKVFQYMLEKGTVCEYEGTAWETKQTEANVAKDIGNPQHVVVTSSYSFNLYISPPT